MGAIYRLVPCGVPILKDFNGSNYVFWGFLYTAVFFIM